MAGGMIQGEAVALPKRNLDEATCRKFGYTVGKLGDRTVQIAPYYRGGQLVAQKTRDANKRMKCLGDFAEVDLFGQQLWSEGGRRIVVTEGEIDAMSVSQAQSNRWPVVSVPSGAADAPRALGRQLEWLEDVRRGHPHVRHGRAWPRCRARLC